MKWLRIRTLLPDARSAYRSFVALLVLTMASLTAALVGREPEVLDRPDGLVLLGEAVAAVSVVTLAATWLVGRVSTRARRAALVGGAFAGAVLGLHLVSEQVGGRIGENSIVTLAAMLLVFTCWTVVGAAAGTSMRDGAIAGFGAAVLSVCLAVTVGFILVQVGRPGADYVATWPEFRRSGWMEPSAFAVANAFDATVGHVGIALVLGPILGILGRAAGTFLSQWRRSRPGR